MQLLHFNLNFASEHLHVSLELVSQLLQARIKNGYCHELCQGNRNLYSFSDPKSHFGFKRPFRTRISTASARIAMVFVRKLIANDLTARRLE